MVVVVVVGWWGGGVFFKFPLLVNFFTSSRKLTKNSKKTSLKNKKQAKTS